MTKNKLKKNGLNLLSILLIGGGVLVWNSGSEPPVYGQTATESSATSVSNTNTAEPGETYQENVTCIVEIADEVAGYDADAISFLQQLYLSTDAASTLSETAWLKFEEYRKNMRQLVTDYSLAQLGQDAGQEFTEKEACNQFVEEHIRVVQAMLREHNLKNAGGKTTYALVTKLKAINKGLKDMNQQFADIFGAFKTFNDKLPGTTK
jgi:hypothetical protein